MPILQFPSHPGFWRLPVALLPLGVGLLLASACKLEEPVEPEMQPGTKLTFLEACATSCMRDNFSGADGTALGDHVPDGGDVPFSWQLTDSDPSVAQIQSNAVGNDQPGGWIYLTSVDAGDAAELEVDVFADPAQHPVQHDVAIVLRANSASPAFNKGYTIFWLIYGDGLGSDIAIDRLDSNLLFQTHTATPTVAGLHKFRAEIVNGGVINVYVDDVLAGSVTDPDPLPPGRAGISFFNGGIPSSVRISSFAATPSSPPPPGEPEIVVTCTPSTLIRGEQVTCTARLNTGETWTPLSMTSRAPNGDEALATFEDVPGGIISSGQAVFSSSITVRGSFFPEGSEIPTEVAGTGSFTVAPRSDFASPEYPAGPPELGSLHDPDRPPTLGAVLRPTLDLSAQAQPPLSIQEVSEGPNRGFTYLLSAPALEAPTFLFHHALSGHGGWYQDQDGIDHGQTTGPLGLRYCVQSDITGPLRDDVIRHESATPPEKSHYSIWVTEVLPLPETREVLESAFFRSGSAARIRQELTSRWNTYILGAAVIYQTPWDDEDLGPNHVKAQQRIGCEFDNIPGD